VCLFIHRAESNSGRFARIGTFVNFANRAQCNSAMRDYVTVTLLHKDWMPAAGAIVKIDYDK
jgi:hypothetical protein